MRFTIQQPKKKGIKLRLLLVFIDKVHSLNNSRDSLVKNQLKMIFIILIKSSMPMYQIYLRKIIFPFDYCDSFAKFKEDLPTKNKFYDTLTNKEISDKNYEHVLNVRKFFNMNTMKKYHDLYLKVDVLLQDCVLEALRIESINSFALDPALYLSTFGYS